MTKPKPKKSEVTRDRILDAALGLFHERGFDGATMRDIAEKAGLALGAAYYHFQSKDAIVLAYYARMQDAHAKKARAAFAASRDLRTRLGAVMHTKLDVVRRERKLLGVLFRNVGEPTHPLSVFSAGTRELREHSITIFQEALQAEALPDDLLSVLAPGLWMVHLGFLLYFIHDTSPQQAKTQRLVDGSMDVLARLIALAKSPHAEPIRRRIVEIARAAGS
jgi:AcrR family transcriptional regulator